ncbi:MAG: tRNA(Ile)-lysidine synthetase [Frankiaceae bacterium]
MKCRRCHEEAVIEVRRHRAAFCRDCFLHHCRQQVRRTIERHEMIRPGERALVAVSGGKDSLAVWDLLLDLGHEADGVYLGLGIGDYSAESLERARAFARGREARLIEVDLGAEVGFTIPLAAERVHRSPCSACGLSKRHLLNKVAVEEGYDVLVTGHNLDDEAAVLLGNVLQWSMEYLARQRPVLPESPGFARRVKPLVAMGERESAAYCVLRGIDYIVDECPMAAGNRHLRYKEALNAIEEQSPGAKATFFAGFLDNMLPMLSELAVEERAKVGTCRSCGAPTTSETCAFCRLRERAQQDAPAKGRRRGRQHRVPDQAHAGAAPSGAGDG